MIIGTALSALEMGNGVFSGLFGKSDSSVSQKEFLENQILVNDRMNQVFFDSYKRDVDNYFQLYKDQRDNKDELCKKIEEVDRKVDMIAVTRPFQDALINAKIDSNALAAQYELQNRTSRMITGQLILPSSTTVTGYTSWVPWTAPVTTTPSTSPSV